MFYAVSALNTVMCNQLIFDFLQIFESFPLFSKKET